MTSESSPSPAPTPTAALVTPFSQLGGEEPVRRLAARFYEHMAVSEPALARLHEVDAEGRVSQRTQDRFTLFLIEWLGGPQLFSPVYGHPRLRMRHARVPVNVAMRDAWLRAMQLALDDIGVSGDVRRFLNTRFAELADFLRNTHG
jgi:hemoglobin